MRFFLFKYPTWLEENKTKISSSDYEKYRKQEEIVTKLCVLFEEEKDDEADVTKKERLAKIIDLMQKVNVFLLCDGKFVCFITN